MYKVFLQSALLINTREDTMFFKINFVQLNSLIIVFKLKHFFLFGIKLRL